MLEDLKEIQKTFNLYSLTLGFLFLGIFMWLFNRQFGLEQSSIKLFDQVLYPEYASALIGLLFALFTIVLYSKYHFLQLKLNTYEHEDRAIKKSIAQELLFYPWLASPLHISKRSTVLFWSMVLLGFLMVGWVSLYHLASSIETKNPFIFRLIGWVDSVIALGALWLYVKIYRKLKAMKKLLNSWYCVE